MIALQNSKVNIAISVYHYYLSGFVVICKKLKKEETTINYANFKI